MHETSRGGNWWEFGSRPKAAGAIENYFYQKLSDINFSHSHSLRTITRRKPLSVDVPFLYMNSNNKKRYERVRTRPTHSHVRHYHNQLLCWYIHQCYRYVWVTSGERAPHRRTNPVSFNLQPEWVWVIVQVDSENHNHHHHIVVWPRRSHWDVPWMHVDQLSSYTYTLVHSLSAAVPIFTCCVSCCFCWVQQLPGR